MASQQAKGTQIVEDIEQLISGALQKLGVKRENDICRYLPASTGGYIHHFTMRKMKQQLPNALADMIHKFIINTDKPIAVRPKQRAARGSRKRKELMNLSRTDLQKMLQLAVSVNDKELIKKLLPKRELKAIKRELISSIRKDIVDTGLWTCYIEAVEHANNPQE
ncbi:MAG: hypothetical protein QRY74_05285 [Chlamydia sp.]